MADTDAEIKNEYADLFRDYSSSWSGYLDEAQLDLEMHLGAHFTLKQIKQAELTDRTLYPFNKTARQVDLIHGYEIRNRHILRIGPAEKQDDEAASQHTGVIMKQMVAGEGYDTLSEAFKWGSLITGSNLLEVYHDREGIVQFGRRPHSGFLLDPALARPDLSDCRNILTGQWLHEDAVKMLLPTEAESIDRIHPTGGSRWRMSPTYSGRDYMRLYEEWWGLRSEFVPTVIDRTTGQELPFSKFKKTINNSTEAAEDVIQMMRMPNGLPVFTKYSKRVQKVIYRIIVDSELVWDGENPTGLDEYNFVWLAGEFCPEMDRDELKLRSLTRRLRAPQNARDKRLNQAIDIIESAIQSGKRVKENSLVNPEDAYKSGQGAVIVVKDEFKGALAEAIDQFGGVDVPPGVFQLIEILDKEETQAGGMNEEILGSDDKDIPALLHKYRTGSALTAQGNIFQNFRRAKRQLGVKLVKLNQRSESPERVFRYLGESPAPGFYTPDFVRFDCTPTEGLLTDSQQAMFFLELQQLYQMFPNLIQPSFVISAAPTQYPKKLLESVKQKEQMESQMMQAQLQTKNQMDNMLAAQAMLDMAKAKGEIVDQDYDRAKTLTEMSKLAADNRLAMVDRYLQLLQLMQSSQQMRSQQAQQARQGA